jgi:hypothetical protein
MSYRNKILSRVLCDVEETSLQNSDGIQVDGVVVTCLKCGHCTESFGTSDASIKRCFALLREQCPNEEENFYDQK